MSYVAGEFGELGRRRADPQQEITSHAEEVTRLPARSAITFRTRRRRTPGCGGLARPNRAASGSRSRIILPSCLGSVPRRGRTLKLYPVVAQPACRDFVKGLVLNRGNADWVVHDRLTGRRNRKHKRSRAA